MDSAGKDWRRWQFVGAVLLYAALTLAFTYPVAWNLNGALAGYADGDNTQAMWSSWWFKTAVVDLRVPPENISQLYFPEGYEQPLIIATPYADISTLPFHMLASPVAVYNLAFLASYLLTAVFTYLFCFHLTGNPWAALVGGFIFAFFSPTRTMHAAAGHFTQSTTYWVPLYALFMVRLLQKPTKRGALACGVFLALAALVSLMQTAYFVIPFTCAALLWGWRQYRNDTAFALRVRYLALTAGVAAVTTAPFFLPFLWRKFFGVWDLLYRPGTVDYSADLLAFFTPSPYHPLFSRLPVQPFLEQVVGGYPFENLVFVGWIPLLLAWYARRERTAWLWGGLAMATGLLSLGPLLKVGGAAVSVAVENITTFLPLPYLLIKQLPLYDMGRTPARLTESVMIGVAALAALGLARLMINQHRRAVRAAMGIGILGVIALEYLTLWPMPVTAAPVPSFYQQIAGDGQEYGILDVPVVNRQVIGFSMYYQTVHRHPIVSGYLWRIPSSGMNLMSFMDSLAAPANGPDIGTITGGPSPVELLARYSIRYVTLHKGYFASNEIEANYRSSYTDALGKPVYEDQQLAIFAVPRSTEGLDGLSYVSVGERWYAAEDWNGVRTRWLGDSGSVFVLRPAEGAVRLRFTAYPYLRNRTVDIAVNGEVVDTVVVGSWQQVSTKAFNLPAGLTGIELTVREGCELPSAAEGEDDSRCLSIAVQNVEVIPGPFTLDEALLITTNFPRWEGDPHSPWLVELLNLLRREGLQVDVLAPAHRGQGDHAIQGMRVHRFRYAPAGWETLTHEEGAPNKIRVNPLYLLLVPLYLLSGLLAAWGMGRRGHYDLIHVYWPVPGGIFGLAARWAGGGRLILTVLGAELVLARRFFFVAPFMKLVARQADGVAAISTFTARELTALTGVEPVLIPFGVSMPADSELPGPEQVEPGMILTVGRLIARKGQSYLIEAIALLADRPQAHLVIVGEGHERPALEATVARLGLAGRVTLRGRVSDEELNRLYRACQIFALPGIVDAAGDTEMLGMVLLEAMRFAKPVVCTRVGGTVDILTDDHNGLLVTEKDPTQLAAAIRRLLDDATLAIRIGGAGYVTARDRFGWKEIVRRTQALYGMP